MDLLILNPHFIPFVGCFIIGFVFIVLAPLHYRGRTKKLFLSPIDIFKYNEVESKMLIYGVIFGLVGILGLVLIDSNYGHRIKITDIHGNTRVERVWPQGHNINEENLREKK